MIIFQYGYSIESISWPTYEKCHKQVGKFIPMLGWRGLPSWIYDNIQNVCWYTAGRNPPSSANRFHNTQYIYIYTYHPVSNFELVWNLGNSADCSLPGRQSERMNSGTGWNLIWHAGLKSGDGWWLYISEFSSQQYFSISALQTFLCMQGQVKSLLLSACSFGYLV